jgi:hypothetical protein
MAVRKLLRLASVTEPVGGQNMSAAKTLEQTNERTQRTEHTSVKRARARARERRASAWRFAHIVALLVGSSATVVGCAAESDDAEIETSEQALMASANEVDVVASPSTRQLAKAPRADATSWTVAQTPGTGFGGGTTVVNFSQDPDGAWHCKGDADCNKMFSSGLCKGGILDSSCDTTGTVECWCY